MGGGKEKEVFKILVDGLNIKVFFFLSIFL